MRFSNFQVIVGTIVLGLALAGFTTVEFALDDGSSPVVPKVETDIKPAEERPVRNLKDLNDAVVSIAEQTKKSVVTVFTKQTVERPRNPLFRFFGQPRRGGGERQVTGLGSGVIVSQDGYILTNNHVVEGADQIMVGTSNGDEVEAKVVGTDPLTDLAVLNIDKTSLPALEFGNSEQLNVGEFVMAIGSPFQDNLAQSVSFGIVSGKGRTIGMARRTGGYENFIQTDAAINPGNSGGALINLSGQLVGINTAIASRSGGNQGVGFAIPANQAQDIMNQLVKTGKVQRGYLGITGGEIDRTMAKALGLEKPTGVIVGSVVENTPAAEAGLKEGDVIRTINGEQIEGWISFRTKIASKMPGDKVKLGILRDGSKQTVTVTLGELPEDLRASAGQQGQGAPSQDLTESIGFKVQNLTPRIAEELQLSPDQDGVVVTGISKRSDAFQQGLREGDVITSVARQEIQNVEDFNNAMSQYAGDEKQQAVLLRVLRQGNGLFVAFEL